MNDACMKALDAVTRAADGEPVGAEEAAAAKRHCATCRDCSEFVSGLAAVQNAMIPAAPESAVATVMERVRAEAERAQRADQAARLEEERQAILSARQAEMTTEPPSRTPASWQGWAGWAAAAAAVLVLAMFVTAQGINYISRDPDTATRTSEDAAMVDQGTPGGDAALAPSEETGDLGAASEAAAGSYIVYQGYVYEYVGVSAEVPADDQRIGSTRSALDSDRSARARSVYGTDDETRIVAEGGAGVYLQFLLVTRGLDGATYGWRADAVEAFGDWPQMPRGIPVPESADGRPSFVTSDVDDLGVPIYTRPGRDTSDGFAVAPGQPPSDPTAGCPEWSWWERQQR